MNIVSGKVISGKKRGRKIGFPTANVAFSSDLETGVFYGRVRAENEEFPAAIFVGQEKIAEAHILDFSDDLYGKEIEIIIDGKIREVMNFKNEEALKRQIEKDIEFSRTRASGSKY